MGIKMTTKWGQVSTFHTLRKCAVWRPDPIILIALILCVLSPAFAQESIIKSDTAGIDQQKISLDLKGINILDLFKILSQKMGVTIVPGKDVSGKLNLYINNLSINDALDVILISQGLACERGGNVINVITGAEYEKLYGRKYNEKRKLKAVKLSYAKPSSVVDALNQLKSDVGKIIVDDTSGAIFLMDTPERIELMEGTIKELDLAPQTEVFDLQYAKPEDIKAHLAGVITSGPGEIIVDPRSTKVIVTDLPEKLKKIRRIIKEFDTQPLEVLIEAKIVEITLRDEYQRQINWEAVFQEARMRGLDLKGTFPSAPSFTPSPSLSTSSQQISMGSLEADDFTETLNFLQTLGDAKIVSEPKVTAVNNQEANIMVGSREAYVLQTLSQAKTTTMSAEDIQFIDVGVKLNVIPAINRDGFITMKIKPQTSTVRETITTTLGSRVPIVDTSEVETTVKIKDGSTLMIAGLKKINNREDVTGVPILSRVPFLGSAGGARAGLKKTTEFIVFLTPRIIKGDVNAVGEDLNGTVTQGLMPHVSELNKEIIIPADTTVTRDNIMEKMKGLRKAGQQ